MGSAAFKDCPSKMISYDDVHVLFDFVSFSRIKYAHSQGDSATLLNAMTEDLALILFSQISTTVRLYTAISII